MNKIKVEFHRNENFVYGRVLEMPEELRDMDTPIYNRGPYALYSASRPQILGEGKTLF